MNKSTIEVSVVIPTYNRPDAVLHCVQSILLSDFSGEIEIIIVDDCSTNCNVEKVVRRELSEDRHIRIIRHERNKNLAAARNTGGRNSHGKYIFFIDDDNELRPDTIRKLVTALEGGKYAVAAPLIVNVSPKGEKTVWASSFAFNEWTSMPKNIDAGVPYVEAYEKGMVGRIIETWYSPNGYMISRDLFERLDGFCEWFGFCMEESDLCMRVRDAGCKVCVVGDAVTWHRHYNDCGDMVMRRFAANTPSKAFRISRNRIHFAWRHYSLPQILSISLFFAPLISSWYFLMACFRGWPRIGMFFIVGYVVGVAQVIGLMTVQFLLSPIAVIGKLFFGKEKYGYCC